MDMRTTWLIDILEANRRGERKGIYAVESQNPTVQEVYLRQALADGSPALFEVSAEILDPHGQSGKILPEDFIGKVKQIAVKIGFPLDRLFFGVNGLSPSLWHGESVESALKKTRAFISDIVSLGFNKLGIHAGIHLKGDPADQLLPREVIIAREAALYQAAELAAAGLPDEEKPLYVIDVHPGQGMIEGKKDMVRKEDVENTVDRFALTAAAAGLPEIKERLLAARVFLGPGYDSEKVIPFDSSLLKKLSGCVYGYKPVIFEALQTDFQPQMVLDQLVDNHFALLSVGPELTYTMREALFSLAIMENETMIGKPGVYLSNFIIELDRAMQSAPQHWQKYYTGNGFEQLVARKYSLYDRSRFYWEDKEVRKTKKRLFDNLMEYPVPLTVLRQFMPYQYERVAAGELENKPDALVMDAVRRALCRYSCACGWMENSCD
jgi:D-tagatose-1,6-bisphosphate aldolase subunit GatZ/KbaZ